MANIINKRDSTNRRLFGGLVVPAVKTSLIVAIIFLFTGLLGSRVAISIAGRSAASEEPRVPASKSTERKVQATAGANISRNVVSKDSTAALTMFTISMVGDVNCGGRVGSVIAKNGAGYPFKNVLKILSLSDIAIGNLECALSSRGTAISGKKYAFRGAPQCGRALKQSGFDMISIANNHSKDFGADALIDTTKVLKQAGLVYAGGGSNNAASFQQAILTVKGIKVAFLAFSDVVPPGFAANKTSPGVASVRDWKRVAAAIKKARNSAGFVIVSIHWGKELSKYPSSRQISLAHKMMDIGVDMVVGHHPHVVQGLESYKGKLVAYSLGNFVFSPANNLGRQSALVKVSLAAGKITTAQVYPVYIDGVSPKIISGKRGESWLREIATRSKGFKTDCRIDTDRGQTIMNIKVPGYQPSAHK